ncbi:MAG: altronate dehydratase family protein [Defluviitaleaceae bacterium]|nr:altronate dehydratase family protein [Defluviitaleaceae bacterium]
MTKTDIAIKINMHDNVAVALEPIGVGEKVFNITTTQEIPKGHKIALLPIKKGENVIKYGYPIGHVKTDIAVGEHIHTHNIATNLKGLLEYEYHPALTSKAEKKEKTFLGYKRKDGQFGIRNEVWIINTVGCVNKTAEKIAAKANILHEGKTDGIYTFVHPYGCSQLGDDHTHTQDVLKNLVMHPNAAAVLVLGLGCENNNIPLFKDALGNWDKERVKFLNTQDVQDEIEEGLKIIEELVGYATSFVREPVNVGNLVIGLKCGGSDGFSGITANPLVGRLSDIVIDHGGTSILTEVPEMFGAETILMNRCVNPQIFDKTVRLINDFKEYFIRHDQEIYENPSPGNKDGGISTLEEKSLGCTQKGGIGNITDVLNYGERVRSTGLNLLQGPGNDIVAVTNLTAAGAHIVLFTTGRGTPLGGPVPTVKVSSNRDLAHNKKNWIDFDASPLLEDTTLDNLGQSFFDYILDVASGKIKTLNEINDYREISIFKDGVTL